MKKNTKEKEEKYMRRNNFDKWLDKLVKERKIDVLEVYTIKKDGKSYELTIKQILECLKLLEKEEQRNIKRMLEEVIEEKESIKECLVCFGVGCVKTFNQINVEETEEAM